MSHEYTLVNPTIKGSMKTSFSCSSDSEAGNKAWTELSQHLTGFVPKFHFTLQKGGRKLKHFVVSEMKENKEVKFKIKPYKLKMTADQIDSFFRARNNNKQIGGKRKKKYIKEEDDSSSSSSSSDEYSNNQLYLYANPVTYYWYNPYLYQIETMFVPTFAVPIVPYVEIDLTQFSSAFF